MQSEKNVKLFIGMPLDGTNWKMRHQEDHKRKCIWEGEDQENTAHS